MRNKREYQHLYSDNFKLGKKVDFREVQKFTNTTRLFQSFQLDCTQLETETRLTDENFTFVLFLIRYSIKTMVIWRYKPSSGLYNKLRS